MEENNEIMNVEAENTTDLATVGGDSNESGFGSGIIAGGLIALTIFAGVKGFKKLKARRRKRAESAEKTDEKVVVDGEAEEVDSEK